MSKWKIWWVDPATQSEPNVELPDELPRGENHAHMAWVGSGFAPDALTEDDDELTIWVEDDLEDRQGFFITVSIVPAYTVYPMTDDNEIDFDNGEEFP